MICYVSLAFKLYPDAQLVSFTANGISSEYSASVPVYVT
jgi:hypothetical protein